LGLETWDLKKTVGVRVSRFFLQKDWYNGVNFRRIQTGKSAKNECCFIKIKRFSKAEIL